MGLAIGGELRCGAPRLPSGSLPACSCPMAAGGRPTGARRSTTARRRESNFVAYVADGYLAFLPVSVKTVNSCSEMWPTVERADRASSSTLQTDHGEMYWAVDARRRRPRTTPWSPGAVQSTRASSARTTSRPYPRPSPVRTGWTAREKLGHRTAPQARALRPQLGEQVALFDGLVLPGAGRECCREKEARLAAGRALGGIRGERGLGCRCVADEPWVTVAESCETGYGPARRR